ncbi:hypothetical protein JI58_05135 [Marinosulfonomonas sp. PRT-SC04]|nr:hypothetical protein JI58_05135 [Marinosulfonomonas sp. PRT-SC04]
MMDQLKSKALSCITSPKLGEMPRRNNVETAMEVDFQSIQEAITLAGNTGSSAQKVAGALEVVKGLFGSTKGGADPEIKLAISDLMLQVANTQASNAQLIQQLTALKAMLETAQAMQSDFDRYELWKAPAGALVYRLKESDDTGQPEHFLCPNCMEGKRKSVLQGKQQVECMM